MCLTLSYEVQAYQLITGIFFELSLLKRWEVAPRFVLAYLLFIIVELNLTELLLKKGFWAESMLRHRTIIWVGAGLLGDALTLPSLSWQLTWGDSELVNVQWNHKWNKNGKFAPPLEPVNSVQKWVGAESAQKDGV